MAKHLTQEQRQEIRQLWNDGWTKKEISEKYCVTTGCVAYVVKDTLRSPNPPCLDGEMWKDVRGYEGRYLVSNYGRVYSTPGSPADHKLLKLASRQRSCPTVSLTNGVEHKTYSVNRLVAEAFVDGMTDDKCLVNNIDGDSKNNHADNLEWVTKADKSKAHRRPPVISDEDAEELKKKWINGSSPAQLAEQYKVSLGKVSTLIDGLVRIPVLPDCELGESWAAVSGYCGRYLISSHGRVYSTGCGRRKPTIMSPKVDRSGYLVIQLTCGHRKAKSHPVHRLVADAFCEGKTAEKNVVNHIDGDKLNNHADNLEWCTPEYNTTHAAHVLGTIKAGNDQISRRTARTVKRDPSSRPSPHRKFTDEEIVSIRNDPRSSRKIAEEYGVNKCTIQYILKGVSYKNI